MAISRPCSTRRATDVGIGPCKELNA
jgi:hypothetical protein